MLLMADLRQQQWAWTMDPCDRLLAAVAGGVGVVGRVVGNPR